MNDEITIQLGLKTPDCRGGDITPSNASGNVLDQAAASLENGKTPGNTATPDIPYSAFSISEKHALVFLVALAGLFSPFSAFIYFPALQDIANDLSVSLELMNLTVTLYLVVQGIVPSLFGDMAETLGRRPVYLLAFSIYVLASVGLALQDSYPALIILRMVQSAGSSGTIALAYGVIGDIAAPYERAGYVGAAHVGFNSAPSLGPVLGGVLADKLGWKWIFRFLAILSGVCLTVMFICFPETARTLVENGSAAATGINRTLISVLWNRRKDDDSVLTQPKFRFPNPIRSLRLVFHKATSLVLFSNAIFYMKYSCVQASLSPLLIEVYGLNELQVGLAYLAFGIACAAASYAVGMITDRDYRKTASSLGFAIDKVKGDDLAKFPIEKARLRSIWYYIVISSASTLGYGWTLEVMTPLAVPLVFQFLISLTVTGIFNVCNTLIVDLHPDAPATASASVSIIRCSVAAIGVSVLQILFDSIGIGWTFTIIASLCLGTIPGLLIVRRRGWDWRKHKAAATTELKEEK
ncbi:hypothetical protein MMC27_007994 [Xylographa pallens]|nr:hypothetical protein [Xylographa pallens]